MNDRSTQTDQSVAMLRSSGRPSRLGVAVGMEWPTVLLIVACSVCIVWVSAAGGRLPVLVDIAVLAIALAFHSSLQHEVIHGHPSRSRHLNEALVFIPFGLFIPYVRFRDLHLQHHIDDRLTDPYDDPESNYLDPADWQRLSRARKGIHEFNNTLAGRMMIGPVVGLVAFLGKDVRAILLGDSTVLKAYLLHVLALAPWLWWLNEYASISVWAYSLAAYIALSLLKVRTFLEHRAHGDVQARTAIVEDSGFFAWLFLNNNLHLVHHRHPRAPWFRLPALYRARRDRYRDCNKGYVYASYSAVFAAHLFRRKDPVPHPLPCLSPEEGTGQGIDRQITRQ